MKKARMLKTVSVPAPFKAYPVCQQTSEKTAGVVDSMSPSSTPYSNRKDLT